MLCYALGYMMKLTEIHNLMLCTRLFDEIDSDT